MEGFEAELRGIFRSVLDRKGTGWLRYGELRYVLLRVGDTLTEEEVNKIFKIHPPDPDGNIRYPGGRRSYLLICLIRIYFKLLL